MRDIPADRTTAGSVSGRCCTATDRPFVTTSLLLIRTFGVAAVLKLHLRRLENSYLAEDSERDRELAISRKEVNLFSARFSSDSRLANLPGTLLRVPGTRDVPKRAAPVSLRHVRSGF